LCASRLTSRSPWPPATASMAAFTDRELPHVERRHAPRPRRRPSTARLVTGSRARLSGHRAEYAAAASQRPRPRPGPGMRPRESTAVAPRAHMSRRRCAPGTCDGARLKHA
jgi:hypothetical protein